jgi:hypothetical protein
MLLPLLLLLAVAALPNHKLTGSSATEQETLRLTG